MDKLEENLLKIKDLLEKAMNNSGIGGTGAIKGGAVLPSISKLPKPGNASTAGKVKIPGVANPGKKNPINVAEQTHNKDIKDIRMKEAHATVVMQKSDEVSFADNGQWSLNKGARNLEYTKTMEYKLEHEDDGGASKERMTTEEEKKQIEHAERNKDTKKMTTEAKKKPLKIESAEDAYQRGAKASGQPHRPEVTNEQMMDQHAERNKALPAFVANEEKKIKARKALNLKKSLKERLNDAIEELDKSNHPGVYDEADNAKRKAKNTGETTGIHTMDSIKAYGGSGPNAAAREAKVMRAKSKKMPVKVFSPEEIAEINKPKE